MFILLILMGCPALYLTPQYEGDQIFLVQEQAQINVRPAGSSIKTITFSTVFANTPQVILTIQLIDKDGGVGNYYIYPSTITASTLTISIYSSQTLRSLYFTWFAFLDDNVFGQFGQSSYMMSGYSVSLYIQLTNQFSQIPSVAFFLNGVGQYMTPTSSEFQYDFNLNSVSQSYIYLQITALNGYGINYFWYSIIYGLPQYLQTGVNHYNILGDISLFQQDSRTKVSSVSITAIQGFNDIRIKVSGTSGMINVSTWSPTIIYNFALSYFQYKPCPSYCTSCNAPVPNCDGCISATYRTGNACTDCQPHMFLIAGEMNCYQCGPFCNQCQGSATTCVDCLPATQRINPPQCDSCASQTFMQYGLDNCQQCVTYCNECNILSTNCSSCQASTLRINPPNCTTCPSQMMILANNDNCQQCSVYCNECSISPTICTQCNVITFRINPPNCQLCPTLMFIESGQQNCQQCEKYCGECTVTADNCSFCLGGTHRVHPPSCITCASQYYIEANVINCQPCAIYCNECTKSDDNCSACLSSSLRTNPPSCTTCPPQYYVAFNVQICQKCNSYCNNCSNYSSYCILCSTSSLRLNPPQCIDCPQYTYLDNDRCTQCDQTCLTCNSNKCLSCLSNQYITTFGKCANCPQHCITCDINTCYTCSGNCALCNFSSCIKCKSDNYYLSGTDCHICPINCLNCDEYSCFTCIGPRIPINNQCECQSPCSTCDSNQCLTCISNNYRIYDKTCQFCQSHCVACDYLGHCYQQPQNCQVGTYINSSLIQCTQCQSNYYLYNNICVKCSPQCLECDHQPQFCKICRFPNLNESECLLCESQIGLYSNYINNTCDSICGDGLISKNEQCDDGNNISRDGCSECLIDPGYYCSGITCYQIVYPTPTLYQNFTLDSVYNPLKQFQLTYNIPIIEQNLNIQI